MPKNETLILFSGKRFIRAYICWLFIACVLPSKFHYSLISFVGRIMLRRHLLFSTIPPHITFFETFLLKVL